LISSWVQPVFFSVMCVVGAVDELADERSVGKRELLARVGDEAITPRAALLGVAEHRVGVVGADEDEVEALVAGDRLQLDQTSLAHGTGIEGRHLGHVVVGRADEARGVLAGGDVHVVAVDPVACQPAAVVGEVLTGRAHEDRAVAQSGHAEADVARDSPAPDLKGVGEEGHRDLVQLLDDEAVGEAATEGHEVV
jgi:hypothetical protein